MQRHVSLIFVLLWWTALIASSRAMATLVPNVDLGALCQRADLIAVGVVADVRREGPTTINVQGQSVEALSMSAELNVQKMLKGNVPNSKLTFGFFIPPPMGYKGIDRGQFGVFFLREAHGGDEVLDPYHPYVPAAPDAPRTIGTCLDQVTAELAHAVASPEAGVRARREAVGILATLPTPAAVTALRTAARDRDEGPRMVALAALLERGDPGWIESAVSNLLSPQPGSDPYLVWRLAAAVQGKVKDPRAIPALARLLHSPDVTVRRAGSAALRGTRDPAAIKPLAQALYDSDRDVLYQAVIGLAEITGTVGEWAPAVSTFQQDPQRYLDHWREWAKLQE